MMKKITLQHANNIIEKGAGDKPIIIITSSNYDAYIEMVGRNNDLDATVWWYKSLINVEEQIRIQVDDVDENSGCVSCRKEEVNDLSIEDMLKKSNMKTDKMLGFQLNCRDKLIYVPFQENRVLSITAVHYGDRIEFGFGGMDKTGDGQFISKTWLRTEFENGEEITVSVLSEAEPVEEHIFLPQKNYENKNESC
jgi:hypothetical protein